MSYVFHSKSFRHLCLGLDNGRDRKRFLLYVYSTQRLTIRLIGLSNKRMARKGKHQIVADYHLTTMDK